MQFSGAVGVGSPPQHFQVIFDTGSSDIWLPDGSCADCAGSRRYRAAASRSHEPLGEPFRLEYGSGNASGRVVRERLLLAELALPRVAMGSASRTTKRLQRFQADGIVGLGLDALALVTKPGLLRADARLRRFSFYVNPLPGALPPAQLVFGGADDALPLAHAPPDAAVVWHHFPLVRYPASRRAHGFWAIRLHRLAVGGFNSSADASSRQLAGSGEGIVAVSAAVAIVDSGTSLMLLPRRAFDATIAEIQQHLQLHHGRELRANPHAVSGHACADCTAEMFPPLRFSFVMEEAASKTQTLVLQGTDYVRCDDLICAPQLDVHALFSSKKNKTKEQTPAASAMTTNVPQGSALEEVVVLGVAFLRTYYALFDSELKTVGFACVESSPAGGDNVCPGGWTPKLQFHSTQFSDVDAATWRAGWVFWSRVYLAVGVLLLVVAFALLWLILVVPSSNVEKVLEWFYGPSERSRRRQQQQQQLYAKASLGSQESSYQALECGDNCTENNAVAEEPDSEPESPRTTITTATAAASRRKSVCYDV
ncbi:unnamed protein product [Phytophthora lilii]|uniref:Unnamed protein product n=1 Tax=Phytophthora lilii TaxID=2077276 RepID=A0A9W6WZ71_9STRA|nr:unnamed protein product [Phytophthora lilii]